MRNAEKHHGMPMIVIAMISAATTQATAANRPPKISHRMLSRKFSGDRVGILIENRLEWLECCFGAAAVGATIVPFSTWSKPPELAYVLADAEIDALFAVEAFAGQNFSDTLAALVPETSNGAPGEW